jgi:hypothetical protein
MDKKKQELKKLGKSKLDPYEINFLPEFEQGRGSREAFVNEYDVIIGDHEYESPESPLQNWTTETDPSVMSGDQWVHTFKDIGFHTEENQDYFEKGIAPQAGRFMHPDKDVAYELNLEHYDGEPGEENQD